MNVNGHAGADAATVLPLLRSFMLAQATRTSISNELDIALNEADITDAALARVIQISSMGLLEVKAETEFIIETLSNGSEERKLCERIEGIEKERLSEATRKQQLQRIFKISLIPQDTHDRTELDNVEQRDLQTALEDSTSRCASIIAERTTWLKPSTPRLGQIVETLNEAISDLRASVADLAGAN
ncbi:MAG: hypothetical protein CYPHOPRED_000183 [Cyphobasidiales sp. Tagirdzhanova-0007]|nr:MAG: hypothetical protein CYPHOPRED_000183 [Cyphobasidiales sp. Tagirdzhanova-0007]